MLLMKDVIETELCWSSPEVSKIYSPHIPWLRPQSSVRIADSHGRP